MKQLRRKLVLWLAVTFGWLLLKTLRMLVRVDSEGREKLEALRAEGRSVLIAIWHGRILLPILQHVNEGITPMISQSRDGEMITRTIEKLGFRSIRGSTSRGGKEAMLAMIKLLKNPGEVAAIMPDGPRGPRHRLKPGVVQIARESGAVILPMTWSARRPIRFASWDRFQLWRPFSRALVIYGDPIDCPPNGDFREQCEQVEKELVKLEVAADERWTAST
jgi:lysophospholipid acyltransferase (LPLAT)-like uncharacterized protein